MNKLIGIILLLIPFIIITACAVKALGTRGAIFAWGFSLGLTGCIVGGLYFLLL